MIIAMVELTVDLIERATFLAGEKLSCRITFRNTNKSVSETVAWASAQLHCQCLYREELIRTPLDVLPSPANDTAFVPNKGEKGRTVAATEAVILLCDLVLGPGESKSYTYTEVIPDDGPPSWSGRLVRYSYKLTVGAQRLSGTVQLLRIPFTVLKLPGSLKQSQTIQSPQNVNNPFCTVDKDNTDSMEEALQQLAADTAKKASLIYTLKNRHGIVGKLLLFKNIYRLGDSIVVSFDFTAAAVKCLQLCVTLQCCEAVPENYSLNKKHHTHCHTHGSQYEYCSHVSKLHVSLPIPPHCTHSFKSELVNLEWQLHFEFVTCLSIGDIHNHWKITDDASMETMSWTLPITVVTADPIQLQDGLPSTQIITL